MYVKIPASSRPNIGAYKDTLLKADAKLLEFASSKLKESGLVPSTFNQAIRLDKGNETTNALTTVLSSFRKALSSTLPYMEYSRAGIHPVWADSYGYTGLVIPVCIKDTNLVYNNQYTSAAGMEVGGSRADPRSPRLGVPEWLVRYVCVLNKLIIKHRLPISIAIVPYNYELDESNFLNEGSHLAKTVRITLGLKINFLTGWVLREGSLEDLAGVDQDYTNAYGRWGRSRDHRNPDVERYVWRSTPPISDETGSLPSQVLLFHLDSFKQIVKTIYRKAEYVPTVYTVGA